MTVEEVFQKLSYGELSNLAAAVDATGTIKKDRQNQVLNFINEALVKLHTRYALRQSEAIVALTGEEQQEAFPAEALGIISLITAWGESLSFGTHAVPGTFYVHERQLWIPPNAVGSELQVTYQLRHPVLTRINVPDDLTQEITLLEDLVEALTGWVGYKMYRDIRTPDALAAANDYAAQYERVCREAENNGVVPGELLPSSKFEDRGFV